MKLSSTEDKRKIALFLPFNAAGHFQSALAIANQFRADHQDVRCVFIITGPPHSRVIEDHGHELIQLKDQAQPYYDFEVEPDDDLSKPMSEADEQARLSQGKRKRLFEGAHRWPHLMARIKYLFEGDSKDACLLGYTKLYDALIGFAYENSDQIKDAIELLEPDLIVGDYIIPDRMLDSQQTCPWVRIYSPNPMKLLVSKLPNSVKPPLYQGYKLLTKEKRTQMARDDPRAWREFLADWVRQSDNRFVDGWNSPFLNLYMFPEAIDYDKEDDLFEYPERWLRCDSLIGKSAGKNETAECGRWLKLIQEKKKAEGLNTVVYFSLGSIASGGPDLMQRYIDYLASDQSDRLYVVAKGVNGDQVQLAERNMLGGNYLPQKFLLQLANLVIIHGGNNSLIESLYYGKPVIVLPSFGDQLENAQRVEDLSLGRRLDLYHCSREELLRAIEDLTSDQELAARVSAIGSEMRSRDNLAMVSSILWELLEKKHLSEETAKKYGIKLH